jgi:hypothetical protein
VVHRAPDTLGELIDRITIWHDAERGHTAQLDGRLQELLSFAGKRKAATLSVRHCFD